MTVSNPPSSLASDTDGSYTSTRTVLVLGAAYAGHRATQLLVSYLPLGWRVVVLERNTHFNHLYAFPRMAVVPGHEHKIFIPYTKLFEPPSPPAINANNVLIHGSLTALSTSSSRNGKPALGRGVATYVPINLNTTGTSSDAAQEMHFDYLIYALGSHLPPPINLWSTVPKIQKEKVQQANRDLKEALKTPQSRGSKAEGTQWLRDSQNKICDAESVLVIGAGALGVQYASDIAWTYGTATSAPRWAGHRTPPKPKRVTLLSSSPKILPRFQSWMHEEAVRSLEALGVKVITGTRADMSTLGDTSNFARRTVRTLDGQRIEADVVLFCTGQRPNTDHLQIYGDVLDPKTGMACVNSFMQLKERNLPIDEGVKLHVFIAGDAADAFGALNAGHTAWDQAGVAARNTAKLIAAQEGGPQPEQKMIEEWLRTPLEEYHAEPHKIKVSLGLDRAIRENDGQHSVIEGGIEDLNAASLWVRRGLDTSDMTV